MTQTTALTPTHPGKDGPDDFEPDQLPVEPDEGPVPDRVPDDPGQLRLVVAEVGRADSVYRSRLRRVQHGKRYAMTVTDFKSKGSTVVTLAEVARLAHAWSGGAAHLPYSDANGPDASRMVWAFAAKQFRL